jgi:Tfp pilus assembly protein PilO
MNENQNPNESEETPKTEPEIIVNDYGTTKDSAVVIEEADRTVLLTENETIVIEKQPRIDIVPKNRPRKVYGGMWGPAEIATVGLGLLAILSVVVLYVFFVLPAQKELEANKAKRNQLEQELISSRDRYGSITDTESHIVKLINSVDDFEGRILRFDAIGKPALYQRLNGLIAAYGLVNTTGPDYAPLEINARSNNGQQADQESGRAKFQSIFPGVYVTTTVEGSYQNLRRFIREIETSDQFIVISAIELEPSEKDENGSSGQTTVARQNPPNQVQPVNPTGTGVFPNNPQATPQTQARRVSQRGKTSGEIVALRIEMAVYFRRPNYQPMAIPTGQQ